MLMTEFNNANEELNPEDIYRVYMEEITAIPPCREEENEKAAQGDPEWE